MNRELMMKAAIKFKGKWPDDNYDLIIATPCVLVLGKAERDGSATYVLKGVAENTFPRSWSHCTRKQFESFVESLFDDAPEGTTHVGSNGLFYKVGTNSAHYLMTAYNEWARSLNKKDWLSNNLIPRPTKKLYIGDTPEQLKKGVTPEAPYMSKVGEECEYRSPERDDTYHWIFFVGYDMDGDMVVQREGDLVGLKHRENNLIFRPIITERQQRAVDLYRMVNNTELQPRDIIKTDNFDTYLSIWDTLVKFKRGDA